MKKEIEMYIPPKVEVFVVKPFNSILEVFSLNGEGEDWGDGGYEEVEFD